MKTPEDNFHKIKIERISEIGRCELCGSKRGLELHHIIPRSIGGEDNDENLILVCYGCHAKLTPRSLLTKMGMNRKCNMFVNVRKIYERVGELLDAGEFVDAICMFDIIDELAEYIFLEPKK